MKKQRYLIGIDEAGRGPLAGPVAIGAVCIDTHNRQLTAKLKKIFPKVKDSKQLSEKRREEWLEVMKKLSTEEGFYFSVTLVSAKHIDARGISTSIKKGIQTVLKKLNIDSRDSFVMLDGGLRAPLEYTFQETFIGGDAKHLPIALASIAAKTTRDAVMMRYHKRFPGYGFDAHKGYGTTGHIAALKKFGPLPIHRKTFLS